LANGSATVTATGGATPYTYVWSNGATTATISNLTAATYTVTVSGGAGCSKTATAVIAASTALAATTTRTATSCNLANGSATVTATGGATPYTYAWSTGATTATISNLTAATYTVTVSGGAGCTSTAVATINGSSILSLLANAMPTQQGQSTGSASATPIGAAPYVYLWSNGGTTATISNLAAGIYTVTATDRNACTATASVTVATITAIDDLQGIANLSLYPNPTTNELYISMDFDRVTAINITFTNAIGQVLLAKDFAPQAHLFHTIDVQAQAAGVYFLAFKTENGQIVRKVFVVR
jgi:hypothetical protein